jgi:hypothetical protein
MGVLWYYNANTVANADGNIGQESREGDGEINRGDRSL